jgi:tetratricopeptide (TPR) repeat protein
MAVRLKIELGAFNKIDMTITDSLYRLFGVPPTCTDDELRRAYHHAILKHHPDRNPHQIDAATIKTQQLTSAYAELKDRRASQSAEPQSIDSEHGIKVTVDGYEFTIQFSFGSGVDIEDIANRKAAFRNEWEKFRQDPSDPIAALHLVHAAFRVEQPNSLGNLLLNPVLIDSASLLLSLVHEDDACETLIRWSELLQHSQRVREAVQILEDAIAAGVPAPSVADKLRSLHYSWAQYSDPTTGSRATPEVRIEHLRRVLELGFEYDYVYKLMAEAYHDLGDDKQARAYLRRAYELNPELSGAVRVSRALGFSKSAAPSPCKAKSAGKYKYSRLEQIPSPAQAREWAQRGNWDAVIEFANPHDYSPRILPKTRETLRQIASSLEGSRGPKAIEALTSLLNFSYYWDVSEAAMLSLSKIGDKHTLDLLETFRAGNSRGYAHWAACISYLRARVSNQHSPATKAAPREL